MVKIQLLIITFIFMVVSSFSQNSVWQRTGGLNGKVVKTIISKDNNIFVGTADSGVFRSSDSGNSWVSSSVGIKDRNIRSLFLYKGNLFVGTNDSGVFRSSDNGTTWQAVNTGISSLNITALSANDSFLFAGTNGGGVCRSSDSGINWLEINKDLIFNNIYSIGTNETYVFTGTWGSSAFRTKDNGLNWFLVTNGLPDPRVNVIPLCFAFSDTFIFTGTGGEGVFRAQDSARAWFPMSVGLPESSFVKALTISGINIFAATQKGVFRSVNNGENWSGFNNGLTDSVVSSFSVNNNNLYAATSNGIWKVSISDLSTKIEQNSIVQPSLFELEQNKPNPFNPRTVIRYTTPKNCHVSIKVYDHMGKEIAVIINERKAEGTYLTDFDASNLASGVYLYRMDADGKVKSKKMMIMR